MVAALFQDIASNWLDACCCLRLKCVENSCLNIAGLDSALCFLHVARTESNHVLRVDVNKRHKWGGVSIAINLFPLIHSFALYKKSDMYTRKENTAHFERFGNNSELFLIIITKIASCFLKTNVRSWFTINWLTIGPRFPGFQVKKKYTVKVGSHESVLLLSWWVGWLVV